MMVLEIALIIVKTDHSKDVETLARISFAGVGERGIFRAT